MCSMASDPIPASTLPTLRQLQFLSALAAHGSFVRAAEAVGVTQPTLSSGIKELEAALGVTLVDRGRGGAALTPAGEDAAASAARILSETEGLVRTMRGAQGPLVGRFTLGVIPTIAPFLLPRALAGLRKRFPQLRLRLKEDLTARLVDGLRARTIDAAIIALPYDAAGIDAAPIVDDEFLLACPADHPLATRNRVTPDLIDADQLLLLEDGHCLRDHALSVCRTSESGAGLADVTATSLHTVIQLVAGGLGVTLLPKLAADAGAADLPGVSVRRFDEPVTGRTLGVAWRAGGARKADSIALRDALVETLAAG